MRTIVADRKLTSGRARGLLARAVACLIAATCGCRHAADAPVPPAPMLVGMGVAYSPRGFSPTATAAGPPEEQLRADLELLRRTGFRSVVSYAAAGTLGRIPGIARTAGFDGTIVMGLWDPFDPGEWGNALAAVRAVDGYCLGNEGLGIRYSPEALAPRMEELRRLTGRRVTTTQAIDDYIAGPHRHWLLQNSDWVFPVAHPVFAIGSDPDDAVRWIVARYDYLAASAGSAVVIKEAGLPSGGITGADEHVQRAFFEALEVTGVPYFHFEAFDQPWKRGPSTHGQIEAHWGLFGADGTPKQAAIWLGSRRPGR